MRYRFDSFELDEDSFELTRNGQPVTVQRLVLETIAFLIRHHHQVVSKDQLIAGPWGGTLVSDATVNHTIMLARRALSDDASSPRLIKTIRGKGFRFVGDLERPQPTPLAPPEGPKHPSKELRTADCSFLGRSQHLESMRAAARNALTGRGAVLLIGGELGSGKTILLERFAAAIGGDADVFWGRCWEGGGAPAFWPWLEVIRGYVAQYGAEWAREMMGAGVSDVANQLPELRQQLLESGARDPVELDDSPQARFRMFGSICQFLQQAAARRPLVVLIDDLHSADDASVRLLEFLSRVVGVSSLLIAGAYREMDLRNRPTLASFLGAPLSHGERYLLSGLLESDVGSMMGEQLGAVPSPDLVRRIFEVTGGNPFLVRELTRQVAARAGQLDLDQDFAHFRIPDRATGIVRDRLRHVPGPTLELLSAASVVGQEFELSLLGGLLGMNSAELLRILEPALVDQIVVQTNAAHASYRFCHALTRETIYRDLPLAQRLSLHFDVATRLEQSGFTSMPSQIAHHFFHASPARGATEALAWSLRAADHALRLFAYESAVEHYQQALQLLDAVGDPTKTCETLLALGRAEVLAGRQGESLATLEKLENKARDLGMNELVAEALLASVEVLREGVWVQTTFPGRLQRALEAIPESSPAVRARLMAALAYATVLSRPATERLALCDQAIALARRVGDGPTLVAVLRASHWTVSQSSQVKSLEVVSELINVARAARQPEKVLDAHMWRAGHLLALGRAQEFQVEMDEHAELARRSKHPWHLWWARILAGSRAQMSGELVLAEARVREALSMGLAVQGPTAALFFATQMLTISLDKPAGERHAMIAEISPMVRKLVAEIPPLRVWFASPMALMDCEMGSLAEARIALEHIADAGFESLPDDQILIATLATLARVVKALGESDLAKGIYDRLAPHNGQQVIISGAAAHWGSVSHYLGILAKMIGKSEMAEEHFRNAVKESRAMGASVRVAWAEYELGCILGARRSPGERRHGADFVRSALGAAQRLGLAQLEADARGALQPASLLIN